jgi:hypothetical protein
MEFVEKVIEFSPETAHALEELAKITGVKHGLGELIQDVLRTYEWAIYQQLHGLKLVALTDEEVTKLALPQEREMLTNLIEPSEREFAQKYFAEAA